MTNISTCFNFLLFQYFLHVLQDEIAFKQKQKEEKKKLDEMKQKASQKGPLGKS